MSSQQKEDQHARRVTRDVKSDVKSAAAELKSRVEMSSQEKEDQRTCGVTRDVKSAAAELKSRVEMPSQQKEKINTRVKSLEKSYRRAKC